MLARLSSAELILRGRTSKCPRENSRVFECKIETKFLLWRYRRPKVQLKISQVFLVWTYLILWHGGFIEKRTVTISIFLICFIRPSNCERKIFNLEIRAINYFKIPIKSVRFFRFIGLSHEHISFFTRKPGRFFV